MGAVSTFAFIMVGRSGGDVRRQVSYIQSGMTLGQVLGLPNVRGYHFDVQIVTAPDDYLLSDYDITKPISSASYAALRTPFNTESPSLNPAGALATLGWQVDHWRRTNRQGDDDMVIVADVFTNGSASLADVVQAPRDHRVLEEFEKALRTDPAFVPASLDRRPETMRVVFSVQRVDVHEQKY